MMKKYLLLLMLITLVACNQSEDEFGDSQQWSTDTIPNPEESDSKDNLEGGNINKETKKTTPFQKEDISGEWDVTMIATAKSCENKEIAPVIK